MFCIILLFIDLAKIAITFIFAWLANPIIGIIDGLVLILFYF